MQAILRQGSNARKQGSGWSKRPLMSFTKKARSESSVFKRYFRVGLEDRAISPWRKAREVWKTNPTCRRISLLVKYTFAIGFIFYWKQGVSLPGQFYLRLLEMELRFRFATRGNAGDRSVAKII